MAVTRAIRRLLWVLTVEEERAQVALEAALAQLHRLESLLDTAIERERAGRRLVAASAHSGEALDRLAGLEETSAARRTAAVLGSRIAEADREAAERREEFLAKRIERRQTETLIREAETRQVVEAARRTQQSIDDRHLGHMRRHRSENEHRQESAHEESSDIFGKLE